MESTKYKSEIQPSLSTTVSDAGDPGWVPCKNLADWQKHKVNLTVATGNANRINLAGRIQGGDQPDTLTLRDNQPYTSSK